MAAWIESKYGATSGVISVSSDLSIRAKNGRFRIWGNNRRTHRFLFIIIRHSTPHPKGEIGWPVDADGFPRGSYGARLSLATNTQFAFVKLTAL